MLLPSFPVLAFLGTVAQAPQATPAPVVETTPAPVVTQPEPVVTPTITARPTAPPPVTHVPISLPPVAKLGWKERYTEGYPLSLVLGAPDLTWNDESLIYIGYHVGWDAYYTQARNGSPSSPNSYTEGYPTEVDTPMGLTLRYLHPITNYFAVAGTVQATRWDGYGGFEGRPSWVEVDLTVEPTFRIQLERRGRTTINAALPIGLGSSFSRNGFDEGTVYITKPGIGYSLVAGLEAGFQQFFTPRFGMYASARMTRHRVTHNWEFIPQGNSGPSPKRQKVVYKNWRRLFMIGLTIPLQSPHR